MRKIGFVIAIAAVISLLPAVSVEAESRLVVDQADLLSEEEEQRIEEKAQEMSEEWNQDFVVVTTQDAEGKDSETYADDYYDDHGYRENGALYLVDKDNNSVWISTTGAAIRFLTDDRIDGVIDAGYDSLKAGEYGMGFLEMLDQTEVYLNAGIPGNQYNYDVETGEISRYRTISRLEFLIALIAAAAGTAIFAVSVTSSYKRHGEYSYPFQEKGRIDFARREDRFINEVVTRRKIPKNTSSGGGSGGGGRSSVHRSGSGRSHGGGGRSL